MTTSDLQSLNDQIDNLQALQKRFNTLRTIPVALLQSPNNVTATQGLESVRKLGEEGLGEHVQSALKNAKQSLQTDNSDLAWIGRRETRKPRRQPSATSPEIFLGKDRAAVSPSVFPPVPEEPVKMEGLPEWARQFNKTHTSKLRLRGNVLRLTIPDIMIAYLSFGVIQNNQILVETIRVFGPREAKGGPHGQSGCTVFQLLSQELGKILEQEENIKLQSLVELIDGYSTLFITPCRVCGRVVSSERHVPAIVRRWENENWTSEHVSCTEGPSTC